MGVSPEDIQRLDQAIGMLNEMVDKVEIELDSKNKIVTVKYYFKSETLARMYYASLQVAFGSTQVEAKEKQ